MHTNLALDGAESDSLHILPLSIIPLRTEGLKKARLVKNVRLEGMVELFGGAGTGSGQVSPASLHKVFHRGDHNRQDFVIVEKLVRLPSYDIYSLRIELRQLGIKVNDIATLRLSNEITRELSAYMAVFTRPLVTAICGSGTGNISTMGEVVNLFTGPNQEKISENLNKMAGKLDITIVEILEFIEDYGDVYLSLAYYQKCLEAIILEIESFMIIVLELKKHQILSQNDGFIKVCDEIETKFQTLVSDMITVIEMFKIRTSHMWDNLSFESFSKLKDLVIGYQTSFGGALCAIAVKMSAWSKEFPEPDTIAPIRCADFILWQMRPGIERIPDIQYAEVH